MEKGGKIDFMTSTADNDNSGSISAAFLHGQNVGLCCFCYSLRQETPRPPQSVCLGFVVMMSRCCCCCCNRLGVMLLVLLLLS
jgi:hypothetical protein